MRRAIGGVIVLLGLLLASPALGAFPGGNGLLAVAPASASGRGILLVTSSGRIVHVVCADSRVCGNPQRPRWSPDGRSLVFAGPKVRIVYVDGTCMNCQLGAAGSPAFKPGGTLISLTQGKHVTLEGIDGLSRARVGVGLASDAVWSAGGKLAIVRGGVLWAGRPDRLQRIALGTDPSWSPGGDRIAAVERGRVMIVTLRGHRVRRLASGSGPAFSPDGRWIAFVSPEHRLMIVSARGGPARPVGNIRAASVDWQPKPHHPGARCAAPGGSRVLASDAQAIITSRVGSPVPRASVYLPALAYMGCLRADGRERLLERFLENNIGSASSITSAVLAARPTVTLCIVTRLDGSILTSTDPGAGAQAWSATTIDPARSVGAIVCSAAPRCFITDGSGHVLESASPTAGPSAWSVSTTTPRFLAGACPSTNLCVTVDGQEMATTTNPAAGAWTSQPVGENLFHVSCPSPALCVAVGDSGALAFTTDPASGAWTQTTIDNGVGLTSVSCA